MFYKTLRNLSRVISVNRCLIFKVHHTWFLWFSSFFASGEAPFLKWALPLYQILLPLSTPFFHLFSFSSPFLQHSRVLLLGDGFFSLPLFCLNFVNVAVGFWFEYNMWRYWLISCFFIRANSIGMWFKQRTFFLNYFLSLFCTSLYVFIFRIYPKWVLLILILNVIFSFYFLSPPSRRPSSTPPLASRGGWKRL